MKRGINLTNTELISILEKKIMLTTIICCDILSYVIGQSPFTTGRVAKWFRGKMSELFSYICLLLLEQKG